VTIVERLWRGAPEAEETPDGVIIRRSLVSFLPEFALTRRIPFLQSLRRVLNRSMFGLCVGVPDPIESYDIIQIHDIFVTIAFVLRCFSRGVCASNIVYSHHSSAWPHGGAGVVVSALTKILRLLIGWLRAVTVESGGTRDLLVNAGIPSSKIYVLPPGRELEEYLVPTDPAKIREVYGLDERPVVLYVGRVIPEKGVDTLIRAFGFLTHVLNVDAQLVIVGPESFDSPRSSGYYSASLVSLSRAVGVADKIRFLGCVAKSDLIKLYNLCSVFVLPSRLETFGSVITEAMAAAKPIIATRTPGALMQVRDGWNGYLVDVGDYQTMAHRIASVLGDRGECERMGRNSLEASRSFSWDVIVEAYLRLLRFNSNLDDPHHA